MPGSSSGLITLKVPPFLSAHSPVAPGWPPPKCPHVSVFSIQNTGSAGLAQPWSL